MATQTASGSGPAGLEVTAIGAVLNGHAAVSVVIWSKSNGTNTDRGQLYTVDNTPNGSDHGLGCRYDATGASWGGPNKLKLSVERTGGVQQLETSDNTQTTALQSIIYSWASGQVVQCWLDGVLDALTTGGTSGAGSGTTSNNSACLMHRGGKDGNNAWNGVIYELRFYDRKLTANEVVAIATRKGSDPIIAGRIFFWKANGGAPGAACSSVRDRAGSSHGSAVGTVTFAEDGEIAPRRRRAA